jgi:hypothetical protein
MIYVLTFAFSSLYSPLVEETGTGGFGSGAQQLIRSGRHPLNLASPPETYVLASPSRSGRSILQGASSFATELCAPKAAVLSLRASDLKLITYDSILLFQEVARRTPR